MNPLVRADVINNVSSTLTDKPLSAAAGKFLSDKLNGKNAVSVTLLSSSAPCEAGVVKVIEAPAGSQANSMAFAGISASNATALTRVVPLYGGRVIILSTTSQTVSVYWLRIIVS